MRSVMYVQDQRGQFAGRNWNHGQVSAVLAACCSVADYQSIELVLRGPSGRFLPSVTDRVRHHRIC